MNESYTWYQTLIKPQWAPPSWLFGPVWTVLYAIIAVTFGTVLYQAAMRRIPWMVALPFALNLVFNAAFTPIQFGLKNNVLASVDIALVLGTLIWALVTLYVFGLKLHNELPRNKLPGYQLECSQQAVGNRTRVRLWRIETGAPTYAWIIYANIPYLLWVMFATVLQVTITILNK